MLCNPQSSSNLPAQETLPDPKGQQRPIRSYVLRQGRFTPAQQRAIAAQWGRFGIDYRGHYRDWTALFPRHAPMVFEIGFGNGHALHAAASHDKGRNYLGVDVHGPGVGQLIQRLIASDSDNVRIYQHDAVAVLMHEIDDASLDEVRIFFPDPWPKKRHTKRRLIQPPFARLLAQKIAVGGRLYLATDWRDYVEQMWDVLDATEGFANHAGPRAAIDRPVWRPQTHFEQRGIRRGHAVWDLRYDRLNTIDATRERTAATACQEQALLLPRERVISKK